MSRPYAVAGHEVFTTASIGIALSSTGYDRSEDILRDADTAMYRAKIDGRSRYEIFDRHMHQQAVRTLQVETDLRHALERSEFRVHYQPIIDLAAGNIVGFEALIRWQHPARGLVPPGEFIPLSEETGLIVPIGWWVLRESCMQMQRWLERFPERQDLTVSVNLSTRQFMQPDLLDQVERALTLSKLPPHALKLEITESVVMQREELVTTMLTALRTRGIRVCIDDFGTGYSSLRYLHDFPVDSLKIDRSFIRSIGEGGAHPRLVETIVALSKNMGMESVAEGVETQEQLDYLRQIGPQFAQGFLFSCAKSADEIEEMLRANPVW
jgi:EAL domain-containing protein (putative c-di-GMP-specific phosphodiesterase class I)